MTVLVASTIAFVACSYSRRIVALFVPSSNRSGPWWLGATAGAVLTALAFLRWSHAVVAAAHALLFVGAALLVEIDRRVMRLPREISWTVGAVSGPLLASADPSRIGPMVVTATGLLALFVAMRLASRRSLGDGDVRLVPVLGLHLGFADPRSALTWLGLTFLSAALVSVSLVVTRRLGRRDAIPFGPFMLVGVMVTLLITGPSVTAPLVTASG